MKISSEVENKLLVYKDMLLEANKKTNLISTRTIKNVWERHICDCAQTLNHFPKNKQYNSFVDIGSGAGLPGIVVKILREEITAHLVESNYKKYSFIAQANSQLFLGMKIYRERFENIRPNQIGKNVILARALLPLKKLLNLTFDHFKVGSIGIFHKGVSWEKEIKEAKNFWKFDFDAHESLTNNKSRIIVVNNVEKK